jgi:putative SOS response-associated peptidase YedK
LPREDYNTWLNPKINEPMQLEPLLKSYPAEEMEYYEVSPRVNNARVDASDLIQPVSRG